MVSFGYETNIETKKLSDYYIIWFSCNSLIIFLNLNNMLKLNCVFFFLLSISISAQTLTKKQETSIKNTIKAQFGEDEAKYQTLNTGAKNFQYIDNDTLFNPHGFHYVFKLKGDTLERLDHSIFHGFDNHRFLFSHNHSLYALGGYGGFVTNNVLKNFNLKLREWCSVKCAGDVPPFLLGPIFKQGNYIFSFYNKKGGNNIEPDILDSNAYRLDLETMHWQKFTRFGIDAKFFNTNKLMIMYTQDYLLLLGELKFIIINSKSNKYLYLNNEEFGIGNLSSMKSIHQNTITFKRHYSEDERPITLDINKIYNANIKKAHLINWKPAEKELSSSFNSVLVGSLFVIIIFIAVKANTWRNKKNSKAIPEVEIPEVEIPENEINIEQMLQKQEANTEPKELKRIVQNFIDLKSEELSWEEMDKILNISHLEGDSRKLRRHRLLKDFPKGMITRRKDDKDKRRFIYFIDRSILQDYYNTNLS